MPEFCDSPQALGDCSATVYLLTVVATSTHILEGLDIVGIESSSAHALHRRRMSGYQAFSDERISVRHNTITYIPIYLLEELSVSFIALCEIVRRDQNFPAIRDSLALCFIQCLT